MLAAALIVTACGAHARKPPPPAALPPLTQAFANPAIGASGPLPADWSAIKAPGFVQLRARDGNALIVIASSGKSKSASELVATWVATIRKTYTSVTLERAVRARLGGLPAHSQVVYGSNRRKVPLRILVAGASGKRVNYVLEAFTALHVPLHDLVEAQQTVYALRLTG